MLYPTAVPINPDITERAVFDSSSLLWVDSPMPGVSRKMLSRDGLEDGQATSFSSQRAQRAGHAFLII